MEQPAIRYARSHDGVSIAFHEFGEGPPLVLVANCPFSHIQRELEIPEVAALWEEQALTSHVIRYDNRGSGLSDRRATDFSLDAQVDDLLTVIDHLGLARVDLLAASVASPAAIAFAARHPSRVSHLVLWYPYARAAEIYRAIIGLVELDWDLFVQTSAQGVSGWGGDSFARAYGDVFRAAQRRDALIGNDTLFATPDVTELASRVQAPTLILVRRDAPATGDDARALASVFPNARLLTLEGDTPSPYRGDVGATVHAVRTFLASEASAERPAAPAAGAELSPRETEVLSLLAGGRTGREIADALGISLSTAQRHIANIYAKIGARGRVDAAAYALARGLVTPRE